MNDESIENVNESLNQTEDTTHDANVPAADREAPTEPGKAEDPETGEPEKPARQVRAPTVGRDAPDETTEEEETPEPDDEHPDESEETKPGDDDDGEDEDGEDEDEDEDGAPAEAMAPVAADAAVEIDRAVDPAPPEPPFELELESPPSAANELPADLAEAGHPPPPDEGDASPVAMASPSMASDSLPRSRNVTITKLAGPGALDATERIETTWPQWFKQLETEPSASGDGDVPCSGWSPVFYDPPKRTDDSVCRVFALVLDQLDARDWDAVSELWATYYGLMYMRRAVVAGMPVDGLRVVLPLARPVSLEEYQEVWRWANTWTANAGCFVDHRSQDALQFWDGPTRPPGGMRSKRLLGKPLDPDMIIPHPASLRTQAYQASLPIP
jgi:hypothetical protein